MSDGEASESSDRHPFFGPTNLAIPLRVMQSGEALPVRVTASMWVEAKGRTPDAALVSLHREVDRWGLEEGWSLEDGNISVVRWEGEYQAEAVLARTVKW